jgi:hypothetical protein
MIVSTRNQAQSARATFRFAPGWLASRFAHTRRIAYDECDFREQRTLLMRCISTRGVLVTGTLLCGFFAASFAVGADEAKVADEPKRCCCRHANHGINGTGQNQRPASLSWLNQRGAVTTDQVIRELALCHAGARTQIEKAVQKRNKALQEANADLSMTLSKTLATSDGELDKRVVEQRERRRLDAIAAASRAAITA